MHDGATVPELLRRHHEPSTEAAVYGQKKARGRQGQSHPGSEPRIAQELKCARKVCRVAKDDIFSCTITVIRERRWGGWSL